MYYVSHIIKFLPQLLSNRGAFERVPSAVLPVTFTSKFSLNSCLLPYIIH